MKTFVCLLLSLCLSVPLFAQEESGAPKLPQEELDRLVAPIALYPDSLVALILPSSTTSADVVLAARYLAEDSGPSAIDNQPWAESVKSLAHFPAVVKWMDENLEWTRQMGEVFEAQPTDVMDAIQRLRAQARQAGLLTDTPQQRVVMQDDEVCIVPAEPSVIYVPSYDPEILWTHRSYYGPFMTFDLGFGIGSWLYFDCDWRERNIWVQHRGPGWVYRPGWHRPEHGAQGFVGAPWHPDPRRPHPERPMHRPEPVAVRPRGIEATHQDFHGRNENPTTQHSNRSDRFIVPVPGSNVSRPPQHSVAPPPPAARPQQAVGPQSQPPPMRDHRDVNHQPVSQPHPPSHTPTMNSRPQTPPPPPAVAPRQVPPPPPSPAARSSAPAPQPAAQSHSSNDKNTPTSGTKSSDYDPNKRRDR